MTKKKYEVNKNGISIILFKDENISTDTFYKKTNFILNQHDICTNSDNIYKLSNIYCNINMKNCVYSQSIMNEIKLRSGV